MLAARARGLGTAWTTVHLMMEQAGRRRRSASRSTRCSRSCLSPLAYTIGTDFKPATRPAPDTIIHWDQW